MMIYVRLRVPLSTTIAHSYHTMPRPAHDAALDHAPERSRTPPVLRFVHTALFMQAGFDGDDGVTCSYTLRWLAALWWWV